jgi:hypothetical protein
MASDLTIFDELPFWEHRNNPLHDSEISYEEQKQLIIEKVELPDFYTFDEPTPAYTLHVENKDLIRVLDENKNVLDKEFSDLEKAYDYVKGELRYDVKFSGDIDSITGEVSTQLVSVPTKNGHHRLLLSGTDEDEYYLAKRHYLDFLELTRHYEKNPNNFVTAFHWLETHPAFWTRPDAESNYWSTDNISRLWIGVTTNRVGETVIMLEHGGAVEPARTDTYHDLRLDVYAPTYEIAIIELAAKVHQFFNVDGSEKENVEYEKSELEKKLDKAFEEYDKNDDEGTVWE